MHTVPMLYASPKLWVRLCEPVKIVYRLVVTSA